MKSFRLLFPLIPFLFFSFSATAAVTPAKPRKLATSGPVDIQAQVLEYHRERDTYTAEGDVELREGLRKLTADHVLYNAETDDVFAEGNVVFTDEEDVIECQKLSLNLVTKKGVIEKGKIFIKQGSLYVTGQEIDKTGESTYEIKRGEFTTCGWDKPAWKFAARDVDVTVGGHAITKGTTFQIRDHKVFYIPWGIFPVKTERQSGFLMPIFMLSSRFGAVLDTAYFWAIDKDKDATFDVAVLQKRGIRPGAEFRYFTSDKMKGQWYGSIINDKVEGRTRDQIRGEHSQVLFGDLTFKTKVNYVSDYKYLLDYGTITERSDNSARSTLFFEKPLPQSLLTVESTYYKSLSQSSNSSTFQYLPFVSYFTKFLSLGQGKLFADLSAEAINLSRDQGDTFQRLILEPKVRVPYAWNGLNFLVTGAFREAYYGAKLEQDQPNAKESAHTETFRLEGDANIQLMKQTYTNFLNLGEVQSIIKPRLRYTYIPNTSYRGIPVIPAVPLPNSTTPAGGFSNVSASSTLDRLPQTNAMTYSLGHYFNQLTKDGVREISLLELEQTYGLSGRLDPSPSYLSFGNRLSDMTARLTLFPSRAFWFTHEDVINFYGDGFKTIRNGLSYFTPLFQTQAVHAYTKDLTNELWFNTIKTYEKFTGRLQLRYSFLDQRWVDALYSLTYHPSCWSVTLGLVQTRRPSDTTIRLSFNLTGLTQRTGGMGSPGAQTTTEGVTR
jgi:LPS-assembly protein